MSGASVLILTSDMDAAAAPKKEYEREVGASGRVVCLPYEQLGSKLALAFGPASFDAVHSLGLSSKHHGSDELTEMLRVLKPGGNLTVVEVVASDAMAPKLAILGTPARTRQDLTRTLILAGLVDPKLIESSNAESAAKWVRGADGSSVNVEVGVSLVKFQCAKPAWQQGAAFSLKKKEPVAAANGGAAKGRVLLAGDDDLIDEESLLAGDPSASAKPTYSKDDCGTGPVGQRKACKNCTCGRADQEKSTKVTLDNTPDCYLGDAFRCSGCPYLGMPPFKPGEKVQLASKADV